MLQPLAMLLREAFFGRLRLDEHERLQHIPDAADGLFLALKLPPGLTIFGRVLLRVRQVGILREARRDFVRERVCLLGAARCELFGNGTLSIDGHLPPGVTIGSLEGSGLVTLGANNLTIGANRLNTTFSGNISGSGSLTKIGPGRLTLSGPNTYTGQTLVRQGRLFIEDTTGSLNVINGNVKVDGGTFGGSGLVRGGVIIGTARGRPALLEPNVLRGGNFIIQKSLQLNSGATCQVDFNSSKVNGNMYSNVWANKVTIAAGALFTINDMGNSPFGPVNLVIIVNTGTLPIAGEFANVPEGGTIVAGQNTYYASYHGGDGNDFTLTTVPP